MTTTNAMVNVRISTQHGYTHISTDEWAKALLTRHTLPINMLVWCIPREIDTHITFQALAGVHSLHLQVPDGMKVANFKLLPLRSLNITGGQVNFVDLSWVTAGPSCALINLRLRDTTLLATTSCSPMTRPSRSSQLDTVTLRNVTGLTLNTAKILLRNSIVSTLSVHECSDLNELPALNLSRCFVLRTDTIAGKLATDIMAEGVPDRWSVIALTGYIKLDTVYDFFHWCSLINLPTKYALLSSKGFNSEQREMCIRRLNKLDGRYINGPRMTLMWQNMKGEIMWKFR
jgi:hypothetical protein